MASTFPRRARNPATGLPEDSYPTHGQGSHCHMANPCGSASDRGRGDRWPGG